MNSPLIVNFPETSNSICNFLSPCNSDMTRASSSILFIKHEADDGDAISVVLIGADTLLDLREEGGVMVRLHGGEIAGPRGRTMREVISRSVADAAPGT